MNLARPIIIEVFGLSPREVRILQAICILSQERPRVYLLKTPDGEQQADFAVVDGDDPRAMAAWQRFQASHPMLPLVMVGKSSKLDWPGFQIGRPLLATRLLALFDQVKLTNERPAFVLPDAETPSPAGTSAPLQEETSFASGKIQYSSALVVDDSFPIRRQMQIELRPFVGHVDLAEDAEQAIELIASRRYDIIFLDVVLPGMDGYKLCRMIKRDKGMKETPVIMLTGRSSPFDRVKGKLAGCDTYLTKPVDLQTFEKVVRQYLPQPKEMSTAA